MDNKAVIQSRLSPDLSVADLAVPEELAVFNFDEEIVDREIMELCMKKATIEDVASIERGRGKRQVCSGYDWPGASGKGDRKIFPGNGSRWYARPYRWTIRRQTSDDLFA